MSLEGKTGAQFLPRPTPFLLNKMPASGSKRNSCGLWRKSSLLNMKLVSRRFKQVGAEVKRFAPFPCFWLWETLGIRTCRSCPCLGSDTTRCPAIQFSPHTNLLELTQTHKFKGKTALTLDASCKWDPQPAIMSDLATKLGFP